jgi:hypothetical protein
LTFEFTRSAVDTDFIAPCTHEEADTRMCLHAKHAAIGGSKSINIKQWNTSVAFSNTFQACHAVFTFSNKCRHGITTCECMKEHAAIGGSKSINILSSDTDVVVIGVAVFDDLNVDHL